VQKLELYPIKPRSGRSGLAIQAIQAILPVRIDELIAIGLRQEGTPSL